MSSIPLVHIVGAGPSGLLLARLLEQHHVPVVVYERESGPDARSQGGTLDLHEDTGLLALKEAGLLEEAQKYMRSGQAEAIKIIDKEGKV
jgi:2-polyprenyl-6-methoxyphenol hydroxylase-like FAD-dependent oxidoreductase